VRLEAGGWRLEEDVRRKQARDTEPGHHDGGSLGRQKAGDRLKFEESE